jgi:uncharacterized caspase-like protein
MRALKVAALAICSIWFCGEPALAEKRVALVIGNSSYQHVTRLVNPANDAAAISATLKGAGFEVVQLKRDLKVSEMRRALRDFSDSVRGADVAVVYYAGHGIEIDGTNYMIPVDAVLERDIDAFDEAIPLDRIMAVIEPAKQLKLVILDACRDNPFDRTMKRTVASRAIGRGLAKVDPDSSNTLIAFAAKAGSVASEGEGQNSPFTTALVKYLPRPGLDLRKAFGYVRDEVLQATNNRQEPFIYGSLGGGDVALVPAVVAPTAAPGPADPNVSVRRDYELAARVGTAPVWDSFIKNHPVGFYTDLAKAQREKLEAEVASAAAAEQARAVAKATDDARIAAEKKKALEDAKENAKENAKAAEADRARIAAQAKAAEDARIAADKAKAASDTAASDTAASGKASAAADRSSGEKPVGQLASLTPPEQAVATAPKSDPPAAGDIARLLQAELRRVGCNDGAVDGNWNDAAQKSLGLFNENAGTTLDVKVASLDALGAVRGKTARVCPLICDHGYKAIGDGCSKILCKAGYELGDDNVCRGTESNKPAAKREPPAKGDSRPGTQRNAMAPANPSPQSALSNCSARSCSQALAGCRHKADLLGRNGVGCSAKYQECMQTGSFNGHFCQHRGLARN